MVKTSNVVARLLMLMGSCTSTSLSLHAVVAEIGMLNDVENSTLEGPIDRLHKVRGTLEATLKETESLIIELEQHKTEYVAKVFGQDSFGDASNN